jgi:peptidoglycan/LPS O-acetylase OafA/YrhL
MSQANHLKFRYDINALRAISVIGVLLFHYKVSFFDGGFAGVDVFFVISGYLMSKIIINGINRNNFSLLEFYGPVGFGAGINIGRIFYLFPG